MSLLLSDKEQSYRAESVMRRRLFLCGLLLGAVNFLLIYGWRILDPCYDDWIFSGDIDLKQHYIGFCHYRMSRWQFPVGLIETLSYPNAVSVIYTDSIPLLAVIFKLFAWFLPVKFQYFGWAGLLSFMLTGGFAALLLYRFTRHAGVSLLYAEFFVISYPIIQRMFYHTALAAQWILLLSLCLWFYAEELSDGKKALLWGITGFLCVSIHSYFLPMCGLILLGSLADSVLKARSRDTGASALRILCRGIVSLFSFCLTALLSLWILGGFYGGTSAVGDGLGTFTSNLNTFVNPLEDGRLYGALPTYNGFQYEGFGYLGGGALFLLIFTALLFLLLCLTGRLAPRQLFKEHPALIVSAALFLVILMLSTFPIVTLGGNKLFGVPYPDFVRSFLGIFRSNGRFIWTDVYLLLLLGCAGSYRLFILSGTNKCNVFVPLSIMPPADAQGFCKEDAAVGGQNPAHSNPDLSGFEYKSNAGFTKMAPYYTIAVLALALQLYDISGMIEGKHETYAKSRDEEENRLILIDPPVPDIDQKTGFVFLYNDNDILMDTAYYGYFHGMWQNNFYFARDMNELVDLNIAQWKAALKQGKVRPDVIYIFKKNEPWEEFSQGLSCIELDEEHIIGVAPK
ncbi:MAG: DUF6311 domain-containing protein [Lachnospiraceae bacterium]|nr:DUF6311 domain-containing protein [Lachnospiraceae bacterium]